MISMLLNLNLSDKNRYGNKASALGELLKKGENVPNGFALSSEFFMKFLQYNKFSYGTEEYLSHNEEIRKFILQAEFSTEMEEELHKFFNNISGAKQKYAVRSSALCEDNDVYSMAGMFSSFINLTSFEEIKTSIKECYISLFSDKVIEYFEEHNLNFEELKMCVIIQQFVEGEYSGVNFSADTIDMEKDIMHINVVNGLCENYVSGKADSAFYKINKKTGEIMEERFPDKFEPLTKDIINSLYERTLKIEHIFKKYQDIEWTIKGNTIYILQARPITTFKIKGFEVNFKDKNDSNYTWYNWSDKPYEPLINELNLMQAEALNIGFYAAGFKDFYGEYCIQNGYCYYRDKEMPNQKRQEEKFLNRINEINDKNQNIFQDILLPQILKLKNELDTYTLKELSPKRAYMFFEKALDYMVFLFSKHEIVKHGCDFLYDFMEYCKKIIIDLKVDDLYDLVFNVSILNKEREFYINMANEIRLNPDLNKMFEECQYNEILYSRLKNTVLSKKLFELIEAYTAEFGICNLESDTESPYLNPLLIEKPSRIIGHIRSYLNLSKDAFKASMENSLKNKIEIKSHILSALDPKGKEEFLYKLELAEKAYLSRDNHHYYFERMSKSYIRLAIVQAEDILIRSGKIETRGDIYFLTVNEIKEGLLKNIELKTIVNERKKTFNYQRKLCAPPMIGKQIIAAADDIDKSEKSIQEKGSAILKGLSGLRKRVDGKVKIGLPTYLDEDVILVLPFTRCGQLEPIINHVKGIIVENGSPFDHLGILARELNIPVLYNVTNVMNILKAGDEVQLDGFAGEVKII